MEPGSGLDINFIVIMLTFNLSVMWQNESNNQSVENVPIWCLGVLWVQLDKRAGFSYSFLYWLTHFTITLEYENGSSSARQCKRQYRYPALERFHMTSRRPYWRSKIMKRRPCYCSKAILCELTPFLAQAHSFVIPVNLHRCCSCEWRRSVHCRILYKSLVRLWTYFML